MTNRIKYIGGYTQSIINYPGGDSIFTREIWITHGSPKIVLLGDGWEIIADFTFANTNIEQIKIPTSINWIGNYAFENTPMLTSVIFNTGSQLTTIGEGAFKMASALTSIEIPYGVETIPFMAFLNANNLKSVTFPSNSQLRTIESNAFSSADLYSLSLPSKLEVIGGFVFSGNNNLHTIYLHQDVLNRLNRYSMTVPLEFGMNNFDENNYAGIDHPVNFVLSVNTQGGNRKLRTTKNLRKRGRKQITKRRGGKKRNVNRVTKRRKTTKRK